MGSDFDHIITSINIMLMLRELAEDGNGQNFGGTGCDVSWAIYVAGTVCKMFSHTCYSTTVRISKGIYRVLEVTVDVGYYINSSVEFLLQIY